MISRSKGFLTANLPVVNGKCCGCRQTDIRMSGPMRQDMTIFNLNLTPCRVIVIGRRFADTGDENRK